MRIFTKIETYLGTGPVILSIGNFDGLHRGHQYLLQKNMDLATQMGARSVVLSFSPHPMQVFKPESFYPLSNPLDQERALEQLGIDDWVIEPFSEHLRGEDPIAFLKRVVHYIPLKAIVVGPDFQFGKNRRGDGSLLKEFGSKNGFEVIFPEAYLYQGHRVSSSHIRRLLKQGDVESAADFLGHPFSVRGRVISGFHRGQKIGFPTANITSASASNLHRGVYSTFVYIKGVKWKGATNVGLHPTFGEDTEVKVETHLLDFNENLYGEEVRVEFIKFIRPEIKFPDVEALKAQIEKDVKVVRVS